jgi:hypothetical protein
MASIRQDPRWHVTERVIRSTVFARAAQLRAILLFIVSRSLEDPHESIREYDIGYSVLGRKSDFNPVEDNIVRVQMGHLRKKLDLYFTGEGASESTTISIPVGGYTPVFLERQALHPESIPSPSEPNVADPQSLALPSPTSLPDVNQATKIAAPKKVSSAKLAYVGLALILVALLLLWARFHGKVTLPSEATTTLANPILQELFTANRTTYTVLADTSLVTLQNVVHSDISISDYIAPDYPDTLLAKIGDPAQRATLRTLALHHYTSLDDADVVGKSTEWAARLGGHAVVRYARLMHVRDFQTGNFIIVGSRRGNPWTSLFDAQLNFAFREDPKTHEFYFENRNPKSGESPLYQLAPDADGGTVTYVDIALLPNLARTGTVLLLNGFSMESNEAAMNIIFSDHLPAPLVRAASQSPRGPLEVLLRVHNVDGDERGYEIVSIR